MTQSPPPPPSDPYGSQQPAGNPYGTPPPPGAPVGTRPGELLDRFLARLIDGVGFMIVYGILFAVFTGIFISGYRSVGEVFLFAIFLNLVATAVYIGYYAFLQSSQGASVGQSLMKLKVVGPDGVSNPTMNEALKRNIWYAVGLIGIVPVVGFFLGPIASIAAVVLIAVTINNDTVNRQGWHDHFAGGTKVLKVG